VVTAAPVIVPSLRALGREDDSDVVTVTLTLVDALGVGWSMVSIANSDRKLPDETKATYLRVGRQLVSAAKAEMAKRIDEAAESARKVGAR
jgi:hypothetical protein